MDDHCRPLTLLFIAIYQMNAWADSKSAEPEIAPIVEVPARQFEWRLRYPGPDGMFGTLDDVRVVNDLHLPVNEEILFDLKSMDVLAQLLSAQHAGQAGRGAGHENSGLVPGRRRPASSIWCVPSCAAGATTK